MIGVMDIAICRHYDPGQAWNCIAKFGEMSLWTKFGGRAFYQSVIGTNTVIAVVGNQPDLEALGNWQCRGMHIDELSDALRDGVCGCVLTETGFVCFRDKLGLIPLVMGERKDGAMIWTTSPDLVLQFSSGRWNRAWLADYLACLNTDTIEDVFEGITRLRAGECFVWQGNSGKRADYWPKGGVFESTTLVSEASMVDRLREALIRAVSRIPEDKPVVYSMSGGLDSTGIVGVARYLSPNKPIHVVSMKNPRFVGADESGEIQAMAEACQLVVHGLDLSDAAKTTLTPMDVVDGFGPQFMPCGNMLMHLLQGADQAIEGARLITGYGGNYLVNLYGDLFWTDLAKHHHWTQLVEEWRALSVGAKRRVVSEFVSKKMGIFKATLGIPEKPGWLHAHLSGWPRHSQAFLPGSWCRADVCHAFGSSVQSHRTLGEQRLFDIRSWNHELFVRSLDRAMRVTGVESFDPLFDSELYALCASFPPTAHYTHHQYRPIYKRALSPFLPERVLKHAKTKDFEEILQRRFTQTLLDEIFQAITCLQNDVVVREMVDEQGVMEAYQTYREAVKAGQRVPVAFEYALWRAISLGMR